MLHGLVVISLKRGEGHPVVWREAFYAGALELIKFAIISLPLVLLIAAGQCMLKEKDVR